MEVSELVRSLLKNRGVESDEHIATFLEPNYGTHTHDPFLLLGMDRAIERLFRAIALNERIAIYADFDCDGIPGAAVLSDFFKKIGYENFEVYLPHRDREGYGFHTEAISELASRHVSLIITVDVGTKANEAVAFAKTKGIETIVTDHHEIDGELPDAVAILNPKRAPYPFPHLCGTAVAFKLVQAALSEGRKRALESCVSIPVGWEKWLLDMVALATVADMVPLAGENRALTHFGLKVLRKSTRPGIDALMRNVRLRKNELTEDDIGFSIAPRINAASRMGEPDLALKLLTTRDRAEADTLAAQLESLNASRKGVVAGVVKEARKHVQTRFSPDDRVVVVGNPLWRPALLGLAANSIMAERGGVVCLWGRDAVGKLKGSCRSDESVSITELFAHTGDVFEEYGGHARSGGFSVSHERVHELPEILKEAAQHIAHEKEISLREADARLSLSDITRTLFGDVSQLAPFGMGNPKPLFLIRDLIVTDVKRFGREKSHTEVLFECRTSGKGIRGYDFFKSPDDFTVEPVVGISTSILGTLERDSFRGGLALRIVDITADS